MKFFDKLRMETQGDAARLQSTPQIVDALHGRITRQAYIDYLAQAFHHVRHTVPLMQAAKARLDDQHARFRLALDEYIEEETGHEEWILDDIAAAGGDAEGVRRSQPNEATELMVAYAYDQVQRGNPMSFFGMVYVLEGTSIQLADMGARVIKVELPETGDPFRAHGGGRGDRRGRRRGRRHPRLRTAHRRSGGVLGIQRRRRPGSELRDRGSH